MENDFNPEKAAKLFGEYARLFKKIEGKKY